MVLRVIEATVQRRIGTLRPGPTASFLAVRTSRVGALAEEPEPSGLGSAGVHERGANA
jgi:hypothetical protein